MLQKDSQSSNQNLSYIELIRNYMRIYGAMTSVEMVSHLMTLLGPVRFANDQYEDAIQAMTKKGMLIRVVYSTPEGNVGAIFFQEGTSFAVGMQDSSSETVNP